MIIFPKNTEQKIVDLGRRTETWSLNPNITCPYCDNTKIWTRMLCSNIENKTSISIYNNSPHFCAECSTRFILHKTESSSPEDEAEGNRIRSTFLDKENQLTLRSILKKEEEKSVASPDMGVCE